jgi:mono/diheme cytochrome c family protein
MMTTYRVALGAATLLLCFRGLSAEDRITRGKYLVDEVGKCQECHTPRLESGEFDTSKWLKGAVSRVAPIKPIKGWHKTAPDITTGGQLWEKWKEAGVRKYMQTGVTPKGGKSDAPMPTYKLSAEDADAVVEYLKTLK